MKREDCCPCGYREPARQPVPRKCEACGDNTMAAYPSRRN